MFALCPPPHMWGGKACFIVAICFIGGITYIVGEVATVLGCVIGIKPGVSAITIVAIGTSLPDLFASMKAATDGRYADSAVGNVTGSNSVNVFLGLGLPWVIAVIYANSTDTVYKMPATGLTLSVIMFLGCSIAGIALIIFRRCYCKGELGGETCGRWSSAIFLISLWFLYVIINTLYLYDILELDI